ncbi:bifunctional 4-hydroxy-2-oxoglutarate aldolase/2-dehydro-3-deoxy-phosphogluconate aldolase [soil metagenome]
MSKFESAARHRIKQMGLMAVLPGDWPVDELLEIGDALLAAPLLVMEITWHSAEAGSAIAALRERFGAHMLVGAGNISTSLSAQLSIKAGAQFISSPGFEQSLCNQSRADDVLYLPVIQTIHEAQAAWRAGCRMIKFQAIVSGDYATIEQIRQRWPELALIPTKDVNLTNIADYARIGAAAVSLDAILLPERTWSQAAIITQARKLRAAWEAASV